MTRRAAARRRAARGAAAPVRRSGSRRKHDDERAASRATHRAMPYFFSEHAAELVLLARLEDREHLVAGLEHGRADGDLRLAVPHHGDQARALGERELLDRLAGDGRALVDLHLDDLEVLLAQLEHPHEPVLGHLVLDEPEDARDRADRLRDPEQVEVRLVPRVVDARDHLLDVVALARDLADDEVVLVVAGDREQEVGRPRDAGALERVDLRRVAEQAPVPELRLEPLEPVARAARSASPRGPCRAASGRRSRRPSRLRRRRRTSRTSPSARAGARRRRGRRR